MNQPTLYDFSLDLRCYAVRLGACLIDVPLTIVDVDVMPGGEHLRAPMLSINALGSVPVLVDGDVTLTQPAAILVHLAKGTRFDNQSPQVLDWMMFTSALLDMFNEGRHGALFFEPGTTDHALIGPITTLVKRRFRQLEDHMTLMGLRGQLFLAGGEPGIPDILAFPAFAQSRDFRVEPEAYPALRLWSRRIRALPGFIGMPGIPDYH